VCVCVCVCVASDERDTVQKKTFTKWVNKHLIRVSLYSLPWKSICTDIIFSSIF